MTVATQSAGNSLLVSRSAAGEKFAHALCLFVGRGKRYSAKEVERGSGVPARMVEAYMVDPDDPEWRQPRLEVVLSIASFLGPEFSSAWLSLAGQGAHWTPEGQGDDAALNTDCAEFNFAYAQATDKDSPGGAEITELERARLARVARKLAPKAQTVAAGAA